MNDNLPIAKVQLRVMRKYDTLLSLLVNPFKQELLSYILAAWQENKSEATIDLYAHVMPRYLRFIGEEVPSPSNVRAFLLSLQYAGRSPFSVHVYFRTLKAWFNWLIREGHMETNPMKNVKAPKLPKRVVQPLTNSETKDIVNPLALGRASVRNRAILLLFLDAGPRLAELAGMKLSDVNLDDCTVKVYGKGAKERYLPFGKNARQALVEYISSRNDSNDGLWVTGDGKPLKLNGVKTMVRRVISHNLNRDSKRGAHTLRHTAAMNYLMNGGDSFTLQTLLGHSNQAMTRHYTESLKQQHLMQVHKMASPVDNLLGKTKGSP